MPLSEEDILLLTQIGFTKTQAKLYLCLIKIGTTDTQNLSKQADVPSQITYRTLGELQKKGIVEKIIGLPQKYKALPIQDGLSIILGAKANEYAATVEKTKEFLLKFDATKEKETETQDYKISVIEGKETIFKRSRNAHINAQQFVDSCSTFQRWIQVATEVQDVIKRAQDRGVRYRIIIEKPNGEMVFPKEVWSTLSHPNNQVRVVCNQLKMNAAIFDGKEASVNFYPSKSLAESPMIWTNHPTLIIGFQDHFEKVWETAEELDIKKIIQSKAKENNKQKQPIT